MRILRSGSQVQGNGDSTKHCFVESLSLYTLYCMPYTMYSIHIPYTLYHIYIYIRTFMFRWSLGPLVPCHTSQGPNPQLRRLARVCVLDDVVVPGESPPRPTAVVSERSRYIAKQWCLCYLQRQLQGTIGCHGELFSYLVLECLEVPNTGVLRECLTVV